MSENKKELTRDELEKVAGGRHDEADRTPDQRENWTPAGGTCPTTGEDLPPRQVSDKT